METGEGALDDDGDSSSLLDTVGTREVFARLGGGDYYVNRDK